MSSERIEPLAGTGTFQWSAGGWFGGQLGGTLWILILSVLVGVHDPLTGGVLCLCFTAPNVVGWSLWRRRDRLRPYPAVQWLVVVEGVFALLAVGFLHLRDALRHLPEESQISPFAMYGALLVFPGLLLFFHLQERSGGGGSPGASPRSPTSAERDQRPL